MGTITVTLGSMATSSGLIQTELANNNDIRISYGKRDDLGVVQCMSRNAICMRDNGTIHVSSNGWLGSWTEITLSDVDPGVFYWALFVYDEVNELMRLCLHIEDDVYHNYAGGGGINDWAVSDFWGIPNTLHPTDATTKTFNGIVRPVYYNPLVTAGASLHGWLTYLNGSCYQFTQIGATETRDTLFIGNYKDYDEPAGTFMTVDGVDWYLEYQFGIIDRDIALALGTSIDVSGLVGGIPADMEMVKRTNVIPDAGAKDPVNIFTYGAGVAVNTIAVDAAKTKVTAGANHLLVDGDVIHFTSVIAGQNNDDWLAPINYADFINNDAVQAWAGDTPPGGNGKFYKVDVIDATNFYLHEAIGCPHNNHICRHIHGLNQIKGGVCIISGEVSDYSNIIFMQTDGTLYSKPLADFESTHITADVDDAIQRAMGFYMNSTHFLWATDLPTGFFQYNLSDRGANAFARYKFRSSGVYRGILSELDDYQSTDLVLQTNELCYMFQVIGNAIFFVGDRGSLYVSLDEGQTWKFIYTFDETKSFPAGFNNEKNEFVARNILFEVLT